METDDNYPNEDENTRKARLECLLAEYRALYGLAEFRMASLDRRVPIAGATLTVSLASVASMPSQAAPVVFVGLPLALIWFLRTTINHARSFEDALRRIEQIEIEINAMIGREAMCFQSRHPSRGKRVGGRTGSETIGAALVAVMTMLVGSGYMFVKTAASPWEQSIAYVGYLLAVLGYMLLTVIRLKRYTYQPR